MLYIIAIGADVVSFPYMSKLIRSCRQFSSLKFICWSRGQHASGLKEAEFVELLSITSNSKLILLPLYMLWSFKIFLYSLINIKKGDVVICSRVDCGLPVALAARLKKFKYVYLDRDASFWSYDTFYKRLLFSLESYVAKNAEVHFIPGESRNYTLSDNVFVIQNTPASWDVNAENFEFLIPSDPLTIYINGWQNSTRGLEHIRNLIEAIAKQKMDVRLLFAGQIAESFEDELAKHTFIENLGVISTRQSIDAYIRSDFVVALYDPRLEINQRAEPNKVFDALFTGCGIISNVGVATLEKLSIEYPDFPFYFIDYSNNYALVDLIEIFSCESELMALRESRNCVYGLEFWNKRIEKKLSSILIED